MSRSTTHKRRMLGAAFDDLKLLLLGILCCGFLVIVCGSDYQIRRVVLDDEVRFSPQEVSWIPLPVSIFFFPYLEIRQTVLESESSVIGVRFSFRTPGFLELHLLPIHRVPLLVLKCQGRQFCVDDQGVAFTTTNASLGLKQVELDSQVSLSPGKSIPAPFQEMILRVGKLLYTPNFEQFSKFIVNSKGEWKFVTKQGIVVCVGLSEGLEDRLKFLPPILRAVQAKNLAISYVDLRREKMPIIKVKNK